MESVAVVGLQWGDEGKGKIVDVLNAKCDICVRYNGGANAGHTVVTNNTEFIFHLLPTGLLHKSVIGVIGNGVVLDPEQFFAEITQLKRIGIDVSGRLFVSERAHIVLPFHKFLDGARESSAGLRIGTTKRGIGLSYADKALRYGLRAADLVAATRNINSVREILRVNLAEKKPLFDSYGITPISESEILNWIRHYGKLLKPFVADTSKLIRDGLASGKRVLFEGAQGALLDIDFGTYPYVTSSQTGVWGIASGAGVLPKQIGRVYGVLKAYTTRVGEGPLPTEERGKIGERLRSAGGEYGATTHRPRRCGWLDLVSVKYAAILNGVDGLIVTKLDVLTGISPLKVAISYRIGNKTTNEFPVSTTDLERVKPVYKDMAGWNEPITKIRQFADLPKAASEYLRFIEEYLKVPIVMVSVGTEREAIIKIKAKRK